MSLPDCACGERIPSEAAAQRHAKACPGQGLPATWTLDDYNAANHRARDAYRADRLAEEGICATCGVNRPGGYARTCWRCQKAKKEKRP